MRPLIALNFSLFAAASLVLASCSQQDESKTEESSPRAEQNEVAESVPSEVAHSPERESLVENALPEPMHGELGELPGGDITDQSSSDNFDNALSLCWADYCPCDKEDPDYGGIDIPLCRNLQMGIAASDLEFSLGAQARDARKQLREFDEDVSSGTYEY